MKRLFLSTTLMAVFLAIMIVTVPFSDVGAQSATAIENPIKADNLDEILSRVIRVLIVTAIPVFGIVMGMGVYYTMTSGNNPQNKQKARKIFMYGFIGFVIVSLSLGIAALLQSLFS